MSISLASKLSYYESQYLTVWRKSPENKDAVGIIYKTYHVTNFIEDDVIASIGLLHNFESRLPVFPKSAMSYFNVKDVCYTVEKNFDLSQSIDINNFL